MSEYNFFIKLLLLKKGDWRNSVNFLDSSLEKEYNNLNNLDVLIKIRFENNNISKKHLIQISYFFL